MSTPVFGGNDCVFQLEFIILCKWAIIGIFPGSLLSLTALSTGDDLTRYRASFSTQPLKKAKVYSFQLDISNVFDIVHCNSVPDCGSNHSERRNRYLFSNGYLVKDWSL